MGGLWTVLVETSSTVLSGTKGFLVCDFPVGSGGRNVRPGILQHLLPSVEKLVNRYIERVTEMDDPMSMYLRKGNRQRRQRESGHMQMADLLTINRY